MRCQDVERLILEASERELRREERAEVEQHVAQCAACASFRDFRQDLQNGLRNAVPPTLPAELDERVRLACRAELKARLESAAGPATARRSAAVPWPIWAALGVLTVLTLAVLIPGLEEFRQGQKLTAGVALALGILLQNAVALFFAPVLMRRRPFSHELEESSNDLLSEYAGYLS